MFGYPVKYNHEDIENRLYILHGRDDWNYSKLQAISRNEPIYNCYVEMK